MRKEFIGTIAIIAVAFIAGAGPYPLQAQQRAAQPAPPQQPAQAAARGQATSPRAPARPARIGGHPNLNGVWQVLNSANWNLEAHPVTGLPRFWQLGAIASIPAGKSVIQGGATIPYTAEALK